MLHTDAFVVVVHGDGQYLLGAFLADDVFIECALDLRRLRQTGNLRLFGVFPFLRDDLVAEVNTLVANKDRRAGNKFFHLVLPFAAERAFKRRVLFFFFRHDYFSFTGRITFFVMTSSTRPYCLASSPDMKKSRSVSAWIFSIGCPVWDDRILFKVSLSFRISLAWISMSVACPWKPPMGWWIMIRAWGSENRLPLVPAPRRSAPMLAAWPMQMVETGHLI